MAAVKFTKKDLTKKVFENAVKDLNKVLDLKPPIVIGNAISKGQLEKDISGVIKDELLTADDKINAKTKAVFAALGLKINEGDTDAVESDAGTDPEPDDVSKALRDAVENLNEVLELDPEMATDDDKQMTADILDVAKNNLRDDDPISKDTQNTINGLQGTTTDKAGPAPTPAEKKKAAAKKKADDKKKAPAKKTTTKPDQSKKVNKMTAIVEAVKDGTNTKDKIIAKAEKILADAGTNHRPQGTKSYVNQVVQILELAGAIEIDGENIRFII